MREREDELVYLTRPKKVCNSTSSDCNCRVCKEDKNLGELPFGQGPGHTVPVVGKLPGMFITDSDFLESYQDINIPNRKITQENITKKDEVEKYKKITHKEKMDAMQEIFNKCLAIADAKGRDYSGTQDAMSNFHDFGWKGIIVRLGDKWNRIKNLTNAGNNFVKDESLEDTLLDNINYSVLALIEKRNLIK